MQLQLDAVRRRDVAEIARLSREQIEVGLPWSWREGRLAAALRRADHVGVVARSDDDGEALVGFCVMQLLAPPRHDPGAAHLVLLAVVPAARRQGVGRELVRWAEQSALCAGVRRVRLEVRATSGDARAFYRALGYVDVARLERYYSGREAAIGMQRELLSDAHVARSRVRADALVDDAIARALDEATAAR